MVIICSFSIDDKRVQFCFQINEIFKSKIGLEQEINKTKRVKTLLSNIESDMRMDVSVRRTYMSIRDGCTCSDRMDVFIRRQPVSPE